MHQFLISTFIPYEKAIKDALDPSIISLLPSEVASLPFKVGFWFLGGIVMVLPAYTITHIILWLKRPRKQEVHS